MFGAMMGMVFVLAMPADDKPPEARVAQLPAAVTTTADDLAAYNVRADRAGRDPEAHVRLALWCEAHGLTPEREKHLAMAVRLDPEHPVARALLGYVNEDGKWRRPAEIAAREKADPYRAALRAEYEAKRRVAPPTADDQARLASWCESKGLAAEARAHLMTVVRIDPSRESAWRALGYVKKDGRWITPSAIARLDSEHKAQDTATKSWVPRLERLVKELNRDATREQAENDLAAITDPRAVPAVMKVLGPRETMRAVQALGQIDAPAASRALSYIAVFASDANVRRAAGESLRNRDPREYAGPLVSLLRDEIKFEVKPVAGPGSTGELWVEGERYDRKRIYQTLNPPTAHPADRLVGFDDMGLPVVQRDAPGMPALMFLNFGRFADMGPRQIARALASRDAQGVHARQWTGAGQDPWSAPIDMTTLFGLDAVQGWDGLPTHTINGNSGLLNGPNARPRRSAVVARPVLTTPIGRQSHEAAVSAVMAQSALDRDVAELQAINSAVRDGNDRVKPLLIQAAGTDLGPKREAWSTWWVDLLGYAPQRSYPERPIFVEAVPPMVQPTAPALNFVPVAIVRRLMSCFAAGTPVHTRDGLKPIESIRVGDQVLAQDIDTGVLGYKPVTVVHHNPPIQTMKIVTDAGSTATASIYHRFWSPGRGWVMARDLKPGDLVRTIGGIARMASIETGETVPVFNLDVADAHSFFVAEAGFLVHDNSIPSFRLGPFDRVEVAAEETR